MMTSVKRTMIPVSLSVFLLCLVQLGCATPKDASLEQVNDDNWSQILEGEWMVEL